ncbi:MAG: protein TolQ, partial [Sideroxydans sp.]|nr:protein TolQ [Sideroxydans sp.]
MDLIRDLSLVQLISNASLPVQLVMGLLLSVSLMSWWYIFLKMFAVRAAKSQTREFEDAFWGNPNLVALYQQASSKLRHDQGALEYIFAAGFAEFVKLKKTQGVDSAALMEGTRRAMRARYQREMDHLESHLSFLATVGSVSPYVGLLGTVWGIMNAFRGLSSVGQATLAQVAPGIAEALVATAMGLFAA